MKEKLSLSDHPLLSQQCFLGRALRKPPLHERYDFQAFGRYQQQMISGELALRNFAARHPLAGYNMIAGLAVAGLLTAAALVQRVETSRATLMSSWLLLRDMNPSRGLQMSGQLL